MLATSYSDPIRPNKVAKWGQHLTVVHLFTMVLLLAGCNTLPKHPHIKSSTMLNDKIDLKYDIDSQTKYDTPVDPTAQANKSVSLSELASIVDNDQSERSGYHPVIRGTDAYVYRSVLTTQSQKSIDVQYYIWHNDETGQLMLQELWQAAQRGVVVRLLLDDFNSSPQFDQILLKFASHPNIAVRLINPMSHRRLKALNFLTNLRRINRRMHNKSMTFDRQFTILGGRNIGNEYLSDTQSNQFADIDVLLVGPVVEDVSKSFDEFWHSTLSYDVQTLVKPDSKSINKNATEDFIDHLDKIEPHAVAESAFIYDTYNSALKQSTISTDLINETLKFRWAPITFISDDVNKIARHADKEDFLVHQLRYLLGKPNQHLTIVSSYFVPTKQGVDTLIKLADEGVKIRILTNSYHANDVSAVHAGYMGWRHRLLKSGIDLFEIKSNAAHNSDDKLWQRVSQSSTSLHAKIFAVDDQHVFIGSYNIDPRSADMNTELGVIIDDPTLANQLHITIRDDMLERAYKVVLTEDNRLQWQTIENHQLISYDHEPNMGVSDHVWIKLMSLLPIDWLL